MKLKSRGMSAPKLAIGDGAMVFWAAIDVVFSEARHQRCWMHKSTNVLNALPKEAQTKAKRALHEIWQAESKAASREGVRWIYSDVRSQISQSHVVFAKGSPRDAVIL